MSRGSGCGSGAAPVRSLGGTLHLDSGTRRDGVWIGRVRVPMWQGTSTAKLAVEVSDELGWYRTYGPKKLAAIDQPGTVRVVSRDEPGAAHGGDPLGDADDHGPADIGRFAGRDVPGPPTVGREPGWAADALRTRRPRRATPGSARSDEAGGWRPARGDVEGDRCARPVPHDCR